ncbi:YHS domain-containing protein [Tsukamurella sp. 1534]|uniref:YHS domain-containing protein n=1 Tax=Tsukamurella sp. 1534 TaxID=1151061 RepID=UPI0003066DAB|nr:YHS domain-containing protein [Tsukamurella sp. 1534]
MTDNAPGQSCCGHASDAAEPLELSRTAPAPSVDEMAECPVMAGTAVHKATAVSKGLYRDFDGTRYYLCCAGCGPKFDADPHKYTAAASA